MFADTEAEDAARHQEPHQVVDDHDEHQQAQHHPDDGSCDHTSLDGHLLKHQQADAGGPSHYVRGVLGVTGEGAVVAELQVLDQDGAITATWVPHKLQPVPEWSLVVEVGSAAGVVEDRDAVPGAIGPVCPGEGDVL